MRQHIEEPEEYEQTDDYRDDELGIEGEVIWDPLADDTVDFTAAGRPYEVSVFPDGIEDKSCLANEEEAGAPTDSPEAVLKRYWGYEQFRPLQRDIIDSILAGNDTLGLMPTGGGKSITFQVPGLMLPGLTMVITPLISLMKDQVDRLRSMGVKATAIHSGMKREQILTTISNCIYGRYKFLYVSPERLSSKLLLSHLEGLNVSLLVVDECHCICQWGYDFRPSYMQIDELRRLLPDVPVLALTATATPPVVEDICKHLGFPENSKKHIFRRSFLRPNLSYSIRRTNNKEAMMLHILQRVEGSAIIYCRNRKLTKSIAWMLNDQSISARFYHAGLSYVERERRQNEWMTGEVRVMVATNAFGMGIDKPDVRVVIHLMMPSSLEEYFQEAGRAGRDGNLSYAVVLVSDADEGKLKRKLGDRFPPMDYVLRVYESVCNYLQIGEGEGFESSFDFDIEHFMRTYRMHPTRTRSAIEILQAAGVWEFSDNDSRSRLNILYRREQLYEFHEPDTDLLIRTILRTYSGLFSDYVFIDEHVIAAKTGYTANEVYLLLTQLSRRGVMHYIPRKNIPRLFFHTRREDAAYLRIPPLAYTFRREQLAGCIEAVLHYIADDNVCRSRLLLAYFGEELMHSCRQCDVCLKRIPEKLPHSLLEDVAVLLEKTLTPENPSYTLNEFVSLLPESGEEALEALRIVLAQDNRYLLDGDTLIFRKS